MIIDPGHATKQHVPWPVRTSDNIGDNYGEGETIKVRCIDQRGMYYNFNRRRIGDVFELIPMWITDVDPNTGKPVMENGQPKKHLVSAKEQFSPNTMERVEDDAPVNITTAQQAINKVQNELDESKIPAKRR